jgi:putative phosphonate transport system ATP-binding protein
MRVQPVLKINNLTKRYGNGCAQCYELTGADSTSNVCPRCAAVVACQGVSLELYQKEVLGIVGESGSGKSTIIRLLHFDMEPTEGELNIRIADEGTRAKTGSIAWDKNLFDLSSFLKRRIRNFVIGVVYQHPHLGLRMDISSGGNVAERLLMADWRNVEKMRQRASDLLEKTEVPVSRIDEAPRNFSGGMQQRVQIAKALSNEPMLFLFDEVTTGLDVSVQARVLDLIKRLQKELDVAAVVVSHDLGVIRMLTSRTMVMKNGEIVESGLTDQVLEDPQHPYTQLLVSSAL